MPENQKEESSTIPPALASILQTAHINLTPPRHDEVWSSWYTEAEDTFADFKSYEPPTLGASQQLSGSTSTSNAIFNSGGSQRTLSARQISGQFDDEVAKSWEEDWEDEDVEDTLDYIMGQMSRYEVAMAANAVK